MCGGRARIDVRIRKMADLRLRLNGASSSSPLVGACAWQAAKPNAKALTSGRRKTCFEIVSRIEYLTAMSVPCTKNWLERFVFDSENMELFRTNETV